MYKVFGHSAKQAPAACRLLSAAPTHSRQTPMELDNKPLAKFFGQSLKFISHRQSAKTHAQAHPITDTHSHTHIRYRWRNLVWISMAASTSSTFLLYICIYVLCIRGYSNPNRCRCRCFCFVCLPVCVSVLVCVCVCVFTSASQRFECGNSFWIDPKSDLWFSIRFQSFSHGQGQKSPATFTSKTQTHIYMRIHISIGTRAILFV